MKSPDAKEALAALMRIASIPIQVTTNKDEANAIKDFNIVHTFIKEIDSLSQPKTIREIMTEKRVPDTGYGGKNSGKSGGK